VISRAWRKPLKAWRDLDSASSVMGPALAERQPLVPIGDAQPGHVSVLYEEVLEGLAVQPGGRYVDGTLGAGGHTEGILERSGPDGQVLGLDADPDAIKRAGGRLDRFSDRAILVQSNFRHLADVARKHGWTTVDGIVLDLGLSSPQLASAHRGFSFATAGPLDMRFDPTGPTATAADIVNTASQEELSRIFFEYGEERAARRIARRIVEARARAPITTTIQLAELVRRAKGFSGRIDPATQVFQALRIGVNDELGSLREILPQATALLRPGGRLAIIAFHSLEDRMVKQYFRQEARSCVCPPTQPTCTCAHQPVLRLITRGALQAGPAEVSANRRARSARLRVAERL